MGTINISRRVLATAIEPRTALLSLTTVSCIGAVGYALLVLFTSAEMNSLYLGLIVLVCAIGVSALHILRTNQKLAIVVYAWLAGICLGTMMIHDALRGERYDHLLWVYPTGVAYLVIYVNQEHALLYALGSALLGTILGVCEGRFTDCVFYAMMPLALWIISASVADVISRLRSQNEAITKIVETWERAERQH